MGELSCVLIKERMTLDLEYKRDMYGEKIIVTSITVLPIRDESDTLT